MIKVTKSFKGVEDGKIYPRVFLVGEEIRGDLARVALEEGWAIDTEKKPPRGKAMKESPRNKHLSSSQAAPPSRKKTLKRLKDSMSSRSTQTTK
jgi:hypothetical protein